MSPRLRTEDTRVGGGEGEERRERNVGSREKPDWYDLLDVSLGEGGRRGLVGKDRTSVGVGLGGDMCDWFSSVMVDVETKVRVRENWGRER